MAVTAECASTLRPASDKQCAAIPRIARVRGAAALTAPRPRNRSQCSGTCLAGASRRRILAAALAKSFAISLRVARSVRSKCSARRRRARRRSSASRSSSTDAKASAGHATYTLAGSLVALATIEARLCTSNRCPGPRTTSSCMPSCVIHTSPLNVKMALPIGSRSDIGFASTVSRVQVWSSAKVFGFMALTSL